MLECDVMLYTVSKKQAKLFWL